LIFSALHFDGRSSQSKPVQVHWQPGDDDLVLVGESGRHPVPIGEVRVGDRLGRAARLIYLGAEGELVCEDHAAADTLARGLAQGGAMRAVFWLERRYLAALLALALSVSAGWYGLRHAMPWLAAKAVPMVPVGVEVDLGRNTLSTLDEFVFHPSRLPPARQAAIRKALAAACARLGDCPQYRLELRAGGRIGANALALPGGTLVMTDELVALAHSDVELIGVLAHELGHVAGRHTLRNALASSGALMVGHVLLGDLGSLGDLSSGLPALLLQTSYTRDMEAEADAYARRFMQRDCLPPGALADLLLRLESGSKVSGKIPEFLSSHPLTADRAGVLRADAVLSPECGAAEKP
jgi:Zn-dependent protease with chaperone function